MPSGNWTTTEIGAAGEAAAATWLRGKGYSTTVNTKGPGSTDIDARGQTKRLLVQVKTAVGAAPADVSGDELRNIKSRAGNIGAEAWIAKVTVAARDLSLTGAIAWTKL